MKILKCEEVTLFWKGQCPGAYILLVASCTFENWCCHIWNQDDKLTSNEIWSQESFSWYQEKVVSKGNWQYHLMKKLYYALCVWEKTISSFLKKCNGQ